MIKSRNSDHEWRDLSIFFRIGGNTDFKIANVIAGWYLSQLLHYSKITATY